MLLGRDQFAEELLSSANAAGSDCGVLIDVFAPLDGAACGQGGGFCCAAI
jgi:hypothetical protein